MREIKFRGYDEEKNCWRYGHFFETVEGIRRCYNIVENREIKYYVNSDTVGQYIGLKDKNGQEIYDGDIVHCINTNKTDIVKLTKFEGIEGSLCIGYEFETSYNDKIEIIGNIHEGDK